jgi:hypothetical protein
MSNNSELFRQGNHSSSGYIIESRPPPIYHQLSTQQGSVIQMNSITDNNNNHQSSRVGTLYNVNSSLKAQVSKPRNLPNNTISIDNQNEWTSNEILTNANNTLHGNSGVPPHMQLGNDGKFIFRPFKKTTKYTELKSLVRGLLQLSVTYDFPHRNFLKKK